jgi:trimeric autotransporter adhesin
MKKITTLLLLMIVHQCIMAQNVGVGTGEPMNKLHIVGNLLVNTPTSATGTPPTAAQTKTMPGLGTLAFLLSTDSTGRLYDAGGPGGNYGIDHDGKATIASSTNIAIEVKVETMDLNTGDSLIIKTSSTGTLLLAVGNRYNTTGKWIFNTPSLFINFKSNTDFNTGAGFSLLIRRLYDNGSSLPDVSGIAGTALFFDAKIGAFRTGKIDNSLKGENSIAMGADATASGNVSTALGENTAAIGFASTAMGSSTSASGDYSTAMGNLTGARGDYSTTMGRQTSAGGDYSTAMGNVTIAGGIYSTAMGRLTNAGGENSTAMGKYTDATGYTATAIGDSSLAGGAISFASGFRTTASGDYSTAMGRQTTASGDFSTAIGNNVSTNSQAGSFIIGDNSSANVMISPTANFFSARFAGGYILLTSSNLSSGCVLSAGANAWSAFSDVRTKENFAEVSGEDFLEKISGFHLTSWNYKTQNPATFRHYGPMAQDFYAAFGKDEYGTIGNDTTINSADFAGVSFIAIQALEKRTAIQQQTMEDNTGTLKKEIEDLKALILQLRKELNEMKNGKQ